MIGLLGSVHCIGMCGGVASALSIAPIREKSLSVSTTSPAIFYNLGRITSYAIAGSLVGGLGNGVRLFADISVWQTVTYGLTNLMLVSLGLYLMNVWHGLTQVEAIGQLLWRHINPLARFILPINTPIKRFLAGSIWGWLPCSMVYSALLTAMFSGTATSGAAVMLAFGLGTLPMLLAVGVFGAHMRSYLQHPAVRITSGVIVIGFGSLGLLRLVYGSTPTWFNVFCIS